jgi:EAL domain-containing protein (putative c-di-GMP-specific phosphodiesterase class I)
MAHSPTDRVEADIIKPARDAELSPTQPPPLPAALGDKLRRRRRTSVADLASDDSEQFKRDLVELENAFERAVGTMTMHFQPIVWANDHRVFGYEALLRTNDPDIAHPGEMFDVAERLNRVERLGRIIRHRVCERAAAEPDQPDRGYLFVNMHALDLLDRSLTSNYSPLAKMRDRVVLEVTERASLEGVEDVRYRIAELREMGYRIAIDDLGAGHARMHQFTLLDTDFVKLDMSLVRGIHEHPIKQRLVASITNLCREQQIQVIGEGVETPEEREVLVRLGCDLLQGYLIARPTLQFADVAPR